MSKHKLMLPILAAIVGVAASAFATLHQNGKPYDTEDYWYQYTGAQNATARTLDSNYSNPQITDFSCNGQSNECAVKATVSLDAQGNPPAHPDFTGASFEAGTGIPEPNTGLIQDNDLKQ